jgi:kumamolisin
MSESDQPRAVVAGSERHRVPAAERGHAADPTEQISVTVVLRRPAPAPQVEANAAPLSREQFAEEHGADPEDVARVKSFAEQYGIAVGEVHRAARTVTLTGSAEALQRAFGASLYRYDSPAGEFRGREGDLTVPEDLSGVVVAVLGLDDRPQVRPHFRAANAEVPHGAHPLVAAALTAPEVAALYDFPTDVNGAGQCIGIVEFGGGYHSSDVTSYFQSLNLPTPTVVSVGVDGATNAPGTAANPNDADGEVALDIEVAGAVAPGAKLAVYFAPNTDRGFLDAVTRAVHDTTNKPSVISISWGGPENMWSLQTQNALNDAFHDAALLGVTVFAAAGDRGSADQPPLGPDGKPNPAYDGHAHVDFPASSPNVLACGGTHLEGSGGAITTETVWNDHDGWATGGGVSDTFDVPTWQQGMGVPHSVNAGGRVGRGVPDVAGNADITTGYKITLYGKDEVFGGTSAVAPLWSGLMALVNQSAGRGLGYVTPQLYASAHDGAFREIKKGSNAIPAIAPQPATRGYSAKTGWDACSGLGSPNGTAIRNLLAKPGG